MQQSFFFPFFSEARNGMLGHSLGGAVIFISFWHFLGFNALLALPTKEGGNKGIK